MPPEGPLCLIARSDFSFPKCSVCGADAEFAASETGDDETAEYYCLKCLMDQNEAFVQIIENSPKKSVCASLNKRINKLAFPYPPSPVEYNKLRPHLFHIIRGEENAPGAGPGIYSGGGYGKLHYFLASRQYHPTISYFICDQLKHIDRAAEDEKDFDRRLITLKQEPESGKWDPEHEKLYQQYFIIKTTTRRGAQAKERDERVSKAKRHYGFFALITNETMDAVTAPELCRNKDVVEKYSSNGDQQWVKYSTPKCFPWTISTGSGMFPVSEGPMQLLRDMMVYFRES